jgi:hypothetical protein
MIDETTIRDIAADTGADVTAARGGWWLKFENGKTLSVQAGPGAYCGLKTAETAGLDTDGEFIWRGQIRTSQSARQVARAAIRLSQEGK